MLARKVDYVSIGRQFFQIFTDKQNRLTQEQFFENFKKYALDGEHEIEWTSAFYQIELNEQVAHYIDAVIYQAYQDYLLLCRCFDEKRISFYNIMDGSQNQKCEQTPNYICQLSLLRHRVTMVMLDPDKNLLNPALSGGCYSSVARKNPELMAYFSQNNLLTFAVSNSSVTEAISLMNAGFDINKYSIQYGNNPILLAIAKGWSHVDTGYQLFKNYDSPQRKIIERLLQDAHLDVNAMHLKCGMTPLHIACLRGDDPVLIKRLLGRGANPFAKDFSNKTPIDYLDKRYDDVKIIIAHLTGNDYSISLVNELEHELNTSTLPTREERAVNVLSIKKLMPTSPMQKHQRMRIKC